MILVTLLFATVGGANRAPVASMLSVVPPGKDLINNKSGVIHKEPPTGGPTDQPAYRLSFYMSLTGLPAEMK